jgi:ribosome biogenesis protein MAK21
LLYISIYYIPQEHPAMRLVVAREVERFIFRAKNSDRSRYYSVIFLNQIVLSHHAGGPEVARKLIDVYFALFRLVVEGRMGTRARREEQKRNKGKGKGKGDRKDGKGDEEKKGSKKDEGSDSEEEDSDGEGGGRGGGKGGSGPSSSSKGGKGAGASAAPSSSSSSQQQHEVDARLLSALLTGINRAFPYVEEEHAEGLIERHARDLFRMVHSSSLNTGVQALALLHQLMSARNAVSDR